MALARVGDVGIEESLGHDRLSEGHHLHVHVAHVAVLPGVNPA